MILRNYKKEDSPIIATWLRTEEELYKWSADRFNKYPLKENDIEETMYHRLNQADSSRLQQKMKREML